MTTPSRALPALRQIPREFAYHVELSPRELLARVEADPDVQMIAGFPARGRSDRKFLVERVGHGFRVCQNLANSGAVDTGPAVLRRLSLEAELIPTGGIDVSNARRYLDAGAAAIEWCPDRGQPFGDVVVFDELGIATVQAPAPLATDRWEFRVVRPDGSTTTAIEWSCGTCWLSACCS